MKKLLTISLLTLLMVLLVVSCSAESSVMKDELAVISFDAAENTTRSLTRTNPGFNVGDLYWNYKAEKDDTTGFDTGATVAETAVNGSKSGLTSVGPFSYGKWKFTLYGYVDAQKEQLAYKGEKNVTIDSQTRTISVLVEALQSENGKGYLEFPLKKDMVRKLDSSSPSMTGIIEEITFDRLDTDAADVSVYDYSETNTESGLRRKELSSGSYSVTFRYYAEAALTGEGEARTFTKGNGYIIAEETIYVSISDNRTTVIGGFIVENLGEVVFVINEAEARVVDTDTKSSTLYKTLEGALGAANEGETVEVLKSLTLTSAITISKDITIDLCGMTLTFDGSSLYDAITVDSGKNVNIKNGTIVYGDGRNDRDWGYNVIFNNGTLSAEKLDVKAAVSTSSSDTVTSDCTTISVLRNDGTATLTDCNFSIDVTGSGNTKDVKAIVVRTEGNGKTTTISGGSLSVKSSAQGSVYGLYLHDPGKSGADEAASTATVSNAKINAESSGTGSVTPVFAERKTSSDKAKAEITVTGTSIKSVISNVESSKTAYGVRAKGNAIVSVDSATAEGISINALESQKCLYGAETSPEGEGGAKGTIKVNGAEPL